VRKIKSYFFSSRRRRRVAPQMALPVILLQYADLPRRWVSEDGPRLPLERARAADMLNARLGVTLAELRQLEEQLERLLRPLLIRDPAAVPPDGTHVRLLNSFMPENPQGRE
jgi:hypothetical protein